MFRYLIRKAIETLAVVFTMMVVTFLLVRMAPGNYADYVLGSADRPAERPGSSRPGPDQRAVRAR